MKMRKSLYVFVLFLCFGTSSVHAQFHTAKSRSELGFLIGGASQNPKKFIDIVKKTYS